MADEIKLTASLSYFKAADMVAAIGRALSDSFDVSGTTYVQGVLSVTTAALAIPLGSVTTPGWGFFYNIDSTNKINLRSGASGTDVVALNPGECAMFRWEGTQTPYAHANNATCLLEYLIISS